MNKSLTFVSLLGLAVVSAGVLTTATGTFAADVDTGADSIQSEKSGDSHRMRGKRGSRGDREAIQTAVEAGDYSLLGTEIQENISADDFADMIAKKAQKDANIAKMESIVQSGDFEAFKTHKDEMNTQREADMQAKIAEKLATATDAEKAKIEKKQAKMEEKKANKGEPTDEELLKKFEKITTYYSENGELPQKKGHGKRGGFGGCGK